MKITSLLPYFFVFLAIILLPDSSFGQTTTKTFEINIVDPVSGSQYTGTVQSIVVNHEEQDVVFAHLNATKTWSFTSPVGVNKSLNEFLSEEEYFNIICISVDGDKGYLNNVRRNNFQKTKKGYKVELSFKSIKY